jgi:hypothetical protein
MPQSGPHLNGPCRQDRILARTHDAKRGPLQPARAALRWMPLPEQTSLELLARSATLVGRRMTHHVPPEPAKPDAR